MRLLPLLLMLAVLAGGLPAGGLAQAPGAPAGVTEQPAETPALKLDRWDAEATVIEKRLAEGGIGAGEIDGMRATLEAQRSEIPALTAAAEADRKPLSEQLDALGPAPAEGVTEDTEVADQRAKLTERIAAIDARLKRLGQADARAAALLSQLGALRHKLFTRELLTRGPSVFDPGAIGRAVTSIGAVASAIVQETTGRLAASRLDARFLVRLLLPLLLIAAALFLVLRVKRAALRWLVPAPARREEEAAPPPPRAMVAVGVTMVRLLMPAVAVAMVAFAVWNSGLIGPQGEVLLGGLAWTALAVIVAYALGGSFYAPYLPQLRLSRLSQVEAIFASRWLMALAAVVGLDLLLVEQGERLGLVLEALEFSNSVLLACGGVALWGYAGYLVPPEREAVAAPSEDEAEATDEAAESTIGPALVTASRVLARTVALIAPALALMGYYAASRFLFYPLVFSGAAIGVAVLMFSRARNVVEHLTAYEPSPDEETAPPSRMRLIPVLLGSVLICALAPVLALIWGADTTDLSAAWRTMSDGFQVGEVTIAPLDFLRFVVVFSVGYLLTRTVQGVLSRSVLPVTGLDAGSQAAVRSGVGYVGITLAALVAISATGLDLSNLAIVAGALSVGIGFGLQNIVNNFVSGIILLVERPIKVGDWVELGSGMGYVKRVNVRSTEIRTFDRASLIVPNSELISGPVTNWTHTDMHGRLIVKVGVAYASDPRRVEAILTEIASAHPMLMRRPAPYILFRSFGADALDFEIRAVLRDVNWILRVSSDINFEIARRFAEEGIEIPFAQRDLHFRNADALGRSIAEAMRESPAEAREAPPAPPRRRPSEPARDDVPEHDDPEHDGPEHDDPDSDT